MSLETTYLGLKLANPLVVGASSLTLNAANVGKCAAAGAGAVVLKSLFEEQINLDTATLETALQAGSSWHTEVFQYMEADIGMRYGTREYLDVIRACKAQVDIPVIASINCVQAQWWQDFAADVCAAGADALELNIALMPTQLTVTAEDVHREYEEIVRAAREVVTGPLAVKLGPYCTSLPELLIRLRKAGADGFVLFNRFYRPTIDIEKLTVVASDRYSGAGELAVSLRWISLLAGRIAADFSAATGVHTGEDLIRMLLAGAATVQVVSTLYRNGLDHIDTLRRELEAWMERKGFGSIDDFRGRVSQAANPDNELFGRLQYIKGLVGIE